MSNWCLSLYLGYGNGLLGKGVFYFRKTDLKIEHQPTCNLMQKKILIACISTHTHFLHPTVYLIDDTAISLF